MAAASAMDADSGGGPPKFWFLYHGHLPSVSTVIVTSELDDALASEFELDLELLVDVLALNISYEAPTAVSIDLD